MADALDIILRMYELQPFLIRAPWLRKLQQLFLNRRQLAKIERKTGERIWRIDQPRIAHRLGNRADPIRPLRMMRPRGMFDKSRAGAVGGHCWEETGDRS